MADRAFQIINDDSDKLKAELLEGLRLFNQAAAGPYHDESLADISSR
jgi:hypothetical protein